MKYKIWDKGNKEYLDLTKYCINGFGDVMTIRGDVFMDQRDFEIQEYNPELLQALKDLWKVKSEPWIVEQKQLKFEVICKVETIIKKYTKDI